jgi:VanZ family protein
MKLTMTTATSRRVAIVYATLVIAVSSIPLSRLPNLGGHGVDKLLHFLQYAILGYLVSRGWGPGRAACNQRLRNWLPALILVLFAAADEFHQHWIPGRYVEFWDWGADAAGVLVSYVLAIWTNRRLANHDSAPSASV